MQVTIESYPAGATVSPDGHIGQEAPFLLDLTLSDEQIRRGYLTTATFHARWLSGATKKVEPFKIYLRNGSSQSFTIFRPSSAPGEAEDVKYALELRKVAIMQQQAASLEGQARAQGMAASLLLAEDLRRQNRY